MRTIGLMSGTSLDGVDGVLIHWSPDLALGFKVDAEVALPFLAPLRSELLALNSRNGLDELHRSALAANGVSEAYAEVVHDLLAQSGVAAAEVRAIGAHGQTVRHQPGLHDGRGYTTQLLNGALLAELTAVDVVCDLRSRDVAAGGQGAPLAPLFHRQVFQRAERTVGILNWGGIANLTVLPAKLGASVLGFDCGPANVMLDAWCQRHTGQAMDAGGAWASTGVVNEALQAHLIRSEAYFSTPPPKSTGRDLFGLEWLDTRLAHSGLTVAPQDVQATLVDLTAWSSAAAIAQHAPEADAVYVCGGGAFNPVLLQRLQVQLNRMWPTRGCPAPSVSTTAQLGVPPMQVEAATFAWLAAMHLGRDKLAAQSITGAQGARVLGCCYPA